MRAMLLLHVLSELSWIGYVVQIDIPEFKQVAQIIQLVRHLCHWVELSRGIHAERICARSQSRQSADRSGHLLESVDESIVILPPSQMCGVH
jgi:hypothetical protein